MKFGMKASEVPVFSGGDYIRNLKKGETTLRFLQECDDWVMYREHYSLDGKSFPCTNDRDSCPGCTHDSEKVSRSSRKYAANVLILPSNTHVVIKMPVTVVNRFQARSDRNNGTVTNRDYIVIKSGDGLDTEYDVESGDRYQVDLDSYELFNIEAMLVEAFEYGTGAVEKAEKPKRTSRVAKPKEEVKSEVLEEPPFEQPHLQSASEDDEEYISEAELREMNFDQLSDIAKEASLVVPTSITEKGDMVDFLLSNLPE